VRRLTRHRFDHLNGRDSLFLASLEGITWLCKSSLIITPSHLLMVMFTDYEDNQWKRENLSTGVAREPGKGYYGSGCVDIAKLQSDPAGYALTIGPFHGKLWSVRLGERSVVNLS